MTLYNQTNIVIRYDTGAGQCMLAANGCVEIPLPLDGILQIKLSLPYGSLSQKPKTGVRWLDRILHRSSLFEEEWNIAIRSDFVIDGLHGKSEIKIVRLVEEFGDGCYYDCLLATAENAVMLSEHYDVPDRKEVLRKSRKSFWRFFLLLYALNGGLGINLLSVALSLFYLLNGSYVEAIAAFGWGMCLVAVLLLIETIPELKEWRNRPRFSTALRNEAIRKHFRGR